MILRLEGEANERPFERARAVIRTVAGKEVWRGPARVERGSPVVLVEVPAGALPRDDYIVELFAVSAQGREIERHRYFLRVRTR